MLWVLFIPLHIARRIYITAKYVIRTPCTPPLYVSFKTHRGSGVHMDLSLNVCAWFVLQLLPPPVIFHRQFQKSVHDVVSAHQAIRNLNTLYAHSLNVFGHATSMLNDCLVL